MLLIFKYIYIFHLIPIYSILIETISDNNSNSICTHTFIHTRNTHTHTLTPIHTRNTPTPAYGTQMEQDNRDLKARNARLQSDNKLIMEKLDDNSEIMLALTTSALKIRQLQSLLTDAKKKQWVTRRYARV